MGMLLSGEEVYVWVQADLCVMYGLPVQQCGQKFFVFLF